MEELKPCPFCGGEARLYSNGKEVICLECECCGPFMDTEAEVIDAWNTRAERTCENVHIEAEDCNFFQCSECGCEITDFEGYRICFKGGGWNYCPNCGRRLMA